MLLNGNINRLSVQSLSKTVIIILYLMVGTNCINGQSEGVSIAWIRFQYLGPSGEAKLHFPLQDECGGLLDWQYIFLEATDLSPPPFDGHVIWSGFSQHDRSSPG